MTHLKQVLVAVILSTTISLGSSGTASAVGTRDFQPDALAIITKANHTTAWQQPKVEQAEPSPTPLPPAPTPAPEPTPVPAPTPVVDPNGCEQQGMRYRADNNECIPNPAPAPQPTAPALKAAPVYTGGPNCELARSLINQYSWNTEVAYNVMVQESTCNPMAANWNDLHGACVGSFGLFQINCGHGQLYDPAGNVAQAFAMWQASGWAPWSFTTCKKVACY